MPTAATIVRLAALGGLVLASGCCGRIGDVHNGEATLSAEEGSPGFLDRVASGTSVCENDACRGVLMLLEKEQPEATFAERVATLRQVGVVPACWEFAADRSLSRGRLAQMIYQACDCPGGLMLTLTGPSPRYCLRELQFRGIIGPGAVFAPVTGMEYVAVLARADAYLQTGAVPETLSPMEGR